MSEYGTEPVGIEESPSVWRDFGSILQSMQPMVQPSDSEQSPSEEVVLRPPGIPEEDMEDLEAQADENYFESMQNLHITECEMVQSPSESSQAVVSEMEVTRAVAEEMESEDRDLKSPDELAADIPQCQELIEANREAEEAEREAELMFEEAIEMEPEAEESDPGPESKVKIIELYSDSDAEEQKIPSDSESQLSQDEQPGPRKEWDQ